MNKFQQITNYYKKNLQNKHLSELIQNKERNEKMLIENDHFMIDLQREKIDEKILEDFQVLYDEHIKPKIKNMNEGESINVTEKQAALHFLLRSSEIADDSNDVIKRVWQEQQDCLKRLKVFSDKVRNSEYSNFENQKFTDIISVGIGGSSLGTECVYQALKHNPKYSQNEKNLKVHFLSNVDPASFVNITHGLNPKTTLVVMISKSFTTAETLQNGNLVKKWILDSYNKQQQDNEIIAKHFVAISANKDLCAKFGISVDNVYPMWNQVGGRFSVSSAVGGLPVSLAFSYEVYQEFLQGMEESDKNFFKENNITNNTACLMSLIDSFHNYTQEFQTKIIIPYSEGLKRFPAHIQQVEMESIGKSYNIYTNKLNEYFVGQFVFGEPGTNSQHSFFQSLHQARVSSIEFIGFSKPQFQDMDIEGKNCYNEFMANMFAQADAFALGKQNKENLWENFSGDRPSTVMLFKNELNAFNLGYLISLYENRCAASGFFADINTFDQYGVNLGKVLAKKISPTLLSKQNEEPEESKDLSKNLINYYNKNRY